MLLTENITRREGSRDEGRSVTPPLSVLHCDLTATAFSSDYPDNKPQSFQPYSYWACDLIPAGVSINIPSPTTNSNITIVA